MDTSPPTESATAKMKYQEIIDNISQFTYVAFTLLLARDVGILDTLVEADKSLTSKEIAASKGLKERYTREILACLVSVELVNISMNESKLHVYVVEEAAKTVLSENTNRAGILLPFVLKSSYQNVIQCLPLNGPMGVGYSRDLFKYYDESDEPELLVDILENVPELKTRLDNGINVLEVASGMASFIVNLASLYPKSNFIASDIDTEQEKLLKNKVCQLPNVRVRVVDLNVPSEYPYEKFDWILMKHACHVVPHPDKSIKGIRRMVAEPDGVFTFIDFFGKGDPSKSIGDLAEAANYASSVFHSLPAGFQQSENSKAYGTCWSKETGIRITQEANFSVESFELSKNQFLVVAKPI